MIVNNFENISENSRIWIFQSNKSLGEEEVSLLQNSMNQFLASWQSHGVSMDSCYKLFFNRFLVVALNDGVTDASGCGIDKLFQHVKTIQTILKIDFFNRMIICSLIEATTTDLESIKASEIIHTHFSDLENGTIKGDSLVFDNSITTKRQLTTHWIAIASNTWIANYLPLIELTNP